jgi:urate oxidase
VDARWRHGTVNGGGDAGAGDWSRSYQGVRESLVAGFVETYSRSLQQTLYAMGQRVLTTCPEAVEIRLSLPNRHHLPSGVPDVFVAADRPYGLIEGTLVRAGAPAAGPAWW